MAISGEKRDSSIIGKLLTFYKENAFMINDEIKVEF